ncbi:MAG: ATP-NAD kinase [Desulfurococcales archaeon ex4484_58]|nr:MAG: ATP-NAD kinase [Desulfurococcales archaeon ex4484_58]
MGFIVNPIAGMGGAVGLKGTDGEAYRLALRRGAKPVSPLRALEFLNYIKINDFLIKSAPSVMGLNIVMGSRHRDKILKVIGDVKRETTAEDTKRIARLMVEDGIDILVFVGGDGTARDICEAVNEEVVTLGVPSGVKMYSSVFAVNPRAGARVFEEYVKGNAVIVEREVLDIDEEAFRRDTLKVKLYGYLKIPVISEYIQSSKSPSLSSSDEEENKYAIARYVIENMEKNTLYILGPGTTVKAISRVLNIPYTLLGVDVVLNGRLLMKDAWEKPLLEILDQYDKVKLIITPIGGQGFLFGRGNQQLTPKVLRRIGKENIVVVATWNKIREIKYLLIDTGDHELDDMLSGYYKVLVDYNRYIVKKAITLQ